jgi:hypothetical protein
MDVPSVHELLMMGLDRLLAERGEPPIERYTRRGQRRGSAPARQHHGLLAS